MMLISPSYDCILFDHAWTGTIITSKLQLNCAFLLSPGDLTSCVVSRPKTTSCGFALDVVIKPYELGNLAQGQIGQSGQEGYALPPEQYRPFDQDKQAIHGALKMESPERNESIPAPVDQGSPFFKYLCGLSPIKPARSVHVVQTYAELSLPPPPAVFTSPPNSSKCGRRVKRGLVISRTESTHVTVEAVGLLNSEWIVDKESHLNQSYDLNGFVAAHSNSTLPSSQVSCEYHKQQSLCVNLEHARPTDASGPTGDKLIKCEYGDVTDYLADPPDGKAYAAVSGCKLVTNSYMLKSSPDCENFQCSARKLHITADDNEDGLSSDYQDPAGSCEDASNGTRANSAWIPKSSHTRTHYQPRDFRLEDGTQNLVSRASDSGSHHENDSDTCGLEKSLEVDQETAAMAFLFAGDADAEDGTYGWQSVSESVLPNISSQQTPDFLGIGRLSSLAQLRPRKDSELAASEANETTTSADIMDRELQKSTGITVSGTLGQRGTRRRCLDFDTSARRNSMGGGSSCRNVAPESKHVLGALALTSVTSIPPSVPCKRAVVTNIATASATAAIDTESDGSLRPECTAADGEILSPCLLQVSRCSFQRNTDLVAINQQVTESGNPSSTLGIPSGIGLHLNSLAGSISISPTNEGFKQTLGIESATKASVASLLGMSGFPSTSSGNLSERFGDSMAGNASGSKNFSVGSTSSNFGTGVVISLMETSRLSVREPFSITDVSRSMLKPSTHSLAMEGRQSLEGSRSSTTNPIDAKSGPMGKKRLPHQDISQQSNVDFADEYDNSQRSPRKRRKSFTVIGEKAGDGCKRCNCKKSKCLKLYCECFAAGTYCVGSCTCHDCFNKPEHEETVMSTRQQIESRNPLAFAPKIVHSGDASPKRGEEVFETPASARHKRGCNCKKSLCLKKYCECYQAGVGCSEGCRCEGCRNMYGRKEVTEEDYSKETLSEALERLSPKDDVDLRKPGFQGRKEKLGRKDLSPITPSFEYTEQGRTTARIRSGGKKRSSSPLPQSYPGLQPPRSPTNTTGSSMNSQSTSNAQQSPDLQRLRSGNSPMSTPNFSRVSQLSPRWDGLGDICTLTPLPQPPLRPNPASISTLEKAGGECHSFSRESMELISSFQLDHLDDGIPQASDHLLPSCEQQDDEARSNPTPCTPRLSSSALPGKNASPEDARFGHLSSFSSEDDETPDFLKYPDKMNSTLITKTSSPKQKRVSPPHYDGIREANRGDGRAAFDSPTRSSPGPRTGRKFILQALPSLPPIMPPLEPGKGPLQKSCELTTRKSNARLLD